MNKHSRNTILYSLLTVSVLASYYLVRQQAQPAEPESALTIVEINERSSEGYDAAVYDKDVLASAYHR